ncbi:MAG: thiamine-phosphate kinase [Candidatus Bathyarchaeia archaeon]
MLFAGELGERKIIEIIIEKLEKMPGMILPFGDDASAVEIGGDNVAIIKTDMLVGKVDVPPGMTPWHAGRKAVVMNVSDLAAKGAKPIAILVALGFPSDYKITDIEQIGLGLNAGAREYGAYVIGGDTSEASDLIISCMVFGVARKKELILRSGAKPGDILAVTNWFGKTAAGLKIILEGLSVPEQLEKELTQSVFMPKARLNEGISLANSQAASAAIDSSDGLAICLHELSKRSNVGFVLETVPIAPEVKRFAEFFQFNSRELALYGGEEYELVVTIKPGKWQQAKEAVKKAGGDLIKIGYATDERRIILKTEKEEISIDARGWEHFKR